MSPSPTTRPSGIERACALLLIAALVGACASIRAPPDGRPLLTALDFQGNDSISDKELESKIVTAPTGGIFKKIHRTWDEDLFAIDRERILRWYRDRGFFEASLGKLDVLPDGSDGPRARVRVRVRIVEGRRTRVSSLTLNGLPLLTPDEQGALLGKLPLKSGDLFDEELYEKDKLVLIEQLKEHGFAAATATGEVQVALNEALCTIVLTANTGVRFQFGSLFINGNQAITSELIVKAADIPRGETFRPSLVAHAQQRIYNLGVFSSARVGLRPLTSAPIADVGIDVREAPFQTVRFGIGAELEQNRLELPRVRVEYTDRNFLGGARRLELVEQAGWAFVPGLVSPQKTGPVSLTTAQITLPSLLPFGIDFIGRGEFERQLQSGFNYFETGARAALQLRAGTQTFVASLNFIRYFAATLDLDLGTLLTNQGTSAALLSSCVPACTLTYPELRYTLDLRDDIVEPRTGLFATASIAQTLKPGSFSYLRLDGELRGYLPLGSAIVLALRAQWGALFLEGDSSSPFTQRFFAGGQNSNRGFSALAQGPQIGASPNASQSHALGLPTPGYATTAIPIGGNGRSLASVELRIRTDIILSKTAIVPFLDASSVTANSEWPLQTMPEFAPGLGLRYLTPFGPLRLDVALRVNPQDVIAQSPDPGSVHPTVVSVRCNTSGGTCVSTPRFAYHLSIGEAF